MEGSTDGSQLYLPRTSPAIADLWRSSLSGSNMDMADPTKAPEFKRTLSNLLNTPHKPIPSGKDVARRAEQAVPFLPGEQNVRARRGFDDATGIGGS